MYPLRIILAAFGLIWAGCTTAADAPPLSIKGEWIQGGILRGQVAPGHEVRVNDEVIDVGPDGEFVFGLGRDEPETVTLAVIGQSLDWHKTYEVARKTYNIQRVEGVPQQTVNPSEAQRKRTQKEAEKVWLARQTQRSSLDYMQTFQWPLLGPISGVYGSQRFYNGEPRRPHYGVDIARPTGTKVVAPAAGLVTLAEPDLFYSGGTLIIDHGHRLSSTFLHLSKLHVEVGQEVEQGALLGEVGASGRATGPHLDWRMNWRDRRVDPTTLVGPMPDWQAQ
ncbi:M23 family metallopeptidase [Gilvimarinus agarilyticus]|uniref:M23 family metallopeptidase n=1 Tax=unclassified Gilvimarinus TaxID=2642066 RepID=UPI001C0A12E5|nr:MULTISPECIES: M23 family metallopeptidase [unclassified Gilvimarinus]MBU2886459.1 M23 family metallopeptidase [Gilvimarinus agarilyticus]MDO6571138.1 M23 family metallopeptidase [Gilvimarinus sp. 2_MG-2023]MDO6745681.1 M23 family metallopeptidase [Gilvimarinus sp. 1_MG-2023]